MPNEHISHVVVDELRAQLRAKQREIDDLHAELRETQMIGIAIGVLLARTPGWTEQDALAAWRDACARLTRDGNTQALASYVVQTGSLPGAGASVNA